MEEHYFLTKKQWHVLCAINTYRWRDSQMVPQVRRSGAAAEAGGSNQSACTSRKRKGGMISAMGAAPVAGMYAHGQKLCSAADNIANAVTDGFKKTRVTIQEDIRGHPEPVVTRINTPGLLVADLQDLHNIRESSNVDLAEELVNMIIATRACKANTKVFEAEGEQLDSLLSIMA